MLRPPARAARPGWRRRAAGRPAKDRPGRDGPRRRAHCAPRPERRRSTLRDPSSDSGRRSQAALWLCGSACRAGTGGCSPRPYRSTPASLPSAWRPSGSARGSLSGKRSSFPCAHASPSSPQPGGSRASDARGRHGRRFAGRGGRAARTAGCPTRCGGPDSRNAPRRASRSRTRARWCNS